MLLLPALADDLALLEIEWHDPLLGAATRSFVVDRMSRAPLAIRTSLCLVDLALHIVVLGAERRPYRALPTPKRLRWADRLATTSAPVVSSGVAFLRSLVVVHAWERRYGGALDNARLPQS